MEAHETLRFRYVLLLYPAAPVEGVAVMADSGVVMNAHSAKREAIQVIERLPDDVPLDEIVYRLYVIDKVQRGLKDVEAGRTHSSEELASEIEAW